VPKIIGCFAGREGGCEAAEPAAQARHGPFGGLAQIDLEFAEFACRSRAAEQVFS